MPIYKRCNRCRKRVPSGSRCSCWMERNKERYKEYDQYKRDKKSKSFYGSREWEAARQEALELDGRIDVYLYMTEGKFMKADAVHHIIPLKKDWSRRSDPENLMSLNYDTHSMIEQRYKQNAEGMIQELQKMLQDFRKLRKAGGI